MEHKKWSRRKVIGSLAIMPLAANAAISPLQKITLSLFPGVQPGNPGMIKCKLLNADGELYDINRMSRFHICDLMSRPFQIDPRFSPGEIAFIPVSDPFRISLPVEVPGFGEVFLYADNRGAGYTARSLVDTEILFLNREFAADRLTSVKRLKKECQSSGISLPDKVLNMISTSERYFTKSMESKGDEKAAAKWAMESLRESLYAGEMMVVERADQLIEQHGARPGFLFGCNAFRFRDYGSSYTSLFESLFNFATLPFYMSGIERVQGQPDYSRVDTLIKALQNTNIVCKGHPLIFLVPDSPDWVINRPFEEIKQICINYIRSSILRYRGRIHIWDVINEAHVQPDIQFGEAIIPGYTKEQTVELSRAAAKAAREADPTCFRIINNTGTWADYYMGRNPAPWQQNAYDYVQMMDDDQIDYEAIGLQYYHSGRDLLEFERDLERFSVFNKPIHITELQIPSSSAEIPGKDWWGGGIGGAGFLWHGKEFSETIQADWVESVYTILYSKPYVDAITYWDMTDPAFVPHGGIVNEDMSPKESYFRLKALLEKWKNNS